MASGKSLELASIPKSTPSLKCVCGGSWATHLRKDGGVLARYDNGRHQPAVATNLNRSQRRRMNHG